MKMRATLAVAVVLSVVAMGLYFYSQRDGPPAPAPPVDRAATGGAASGERQADAGTARVAEAASEAAGEAAAQARDAGGEAVSEAVARAVTESIAAADRDTAAGADAESVTRAVNERVTAVLGGDKGAAVREAVSEAVSGAIVGKQAESYVEGITAPPVEPLAVAHADHFVTRDQVISLLPETSIELTTPAALSADEALAADTPITVVREVEQIETTTPERIIAAAGGDLERPVRIVVDEKVREVTVRTVLEQFSANPDEPISVVKLVRHFEQTTPAELQADQTVAADVPLKVIRQRYNLEAATVAELLRQRSDLDPDTIFYVRTVNPEDQQGIWGIVQHGLIGNFAQGVAVRRGEKVDTYRVDIPADADEKLGDRSSSYLGRLIHAKTIESYVYNFKENRMGRNPDRIYPGQEIVIINFSPRELIDIYKHFVGNRG